MKKRFIITNLDTMEKVTVEIPISKSIFEKLNAILNNFWGLLPPNSWKEDFFQTNEAIYYTEKGLFRIQLDWYDFTFTVKQIY
jgi:hypothetical protein